MRLEYMLLADKAEAINGKLYLFGGSWDTLTLGGAPALASYDLAASILFSADEAGAHDLAFELLGPDGETVLGPLGGSIQATVPEQGDLVRVLAVLRGPFPQAAGGKHQWQVKIDGKSVGTVALTVVVGPGSESSSGVEAPSPSLAGPVP